MPKTQVKRHFWSQIAVLPPPHKVRRPRRRPPPEARQIVHFTRFQLLGPHRGPACPKPSVKQHFWSKIAVLPPPQGVHRPRRRPPPEALQIVRFTRFQLLWPHRGPACPKPLDIEGPGNNQRIDKPDDRNLNAQISQKVRCELCSLSSKRSLPRRSGRSPLG